MTEPIGEQRPRVDEIPLLLSLYACSLIYEIRCGALRGEGTKTYALVGSNDREPLQTYEGEEMVQNKEYVSIYKRVRRQQSHSEAGTSCCHSPRTRPVSEGNFRRSF